MAQAAPSVAALIARAEERARQDAGFAEALAELVEAPTRGAGEYTNKAARSVNRQRVASAVEEFKADAITTQNVQRLLNLGTPQAVHQLRRRKRLLGLAAGNATWFPAWQFEEGRLRPDLARVLAHLARFSADPVAADRVMRLVRDDLDGRSLNEALKEPDLAGMRGPSSGLSAPDGTFPATLLLGTVLPPPPAPRCDGSTNRSARMRLDRARATRFRVRHAGTSMVGAARERYLDSSRFVPARLRHPALVHLVGTQPPAALDGCQQHRVRDIQVAA